MNTIKSNIEISGKGLMDGIESIIKIEPSEKKGIYFYPDNSKEPVKASLENVISTQNCTILGNNGMQVRVVEHFMAACAFAGIDSIDVYMSGSELPILDGSALTWFEAFNNAGVSYDNVNQANNIEINSPLYYAFNNTNLFLIPAETFKVSYCVNFHHPDLQNRWINWNKDNDNLDIIQARTFGYLKDLERFQQAGLALGVSIDNTIGLIDDGYTTELRTQYEPLKHKILDLIGDLNLIGINPLNFNVHIFAQEAGHKTHVDFARVINSYLESKNVN